MAYATAVVSPQVVQAQPAAVRHVQAQVVAPPNHQYASPYAQPSVVMGDPRFGLTPDIPRGAPPGGRWINQPEPGIITCCIAVILFPCVRTRIITQSYFPDSPMLLARGLPILLFFPTSCTHAFVGSAPTRL